MRPSAFLGGDNGFDSFPSFHIDFPKIKPDPEMEKMTNEMDRKMAEAWKNDEKVDHKQIPKHQTT